MRTKGTIRTGKPQTSPSKPAHTRGVRQGNEVGSYERQPGHLPEGKATSRRSTGIGHEHRNPIDSRMPNLPPA